MKPLLRSICNQIYCACCFVPPFLGGIAWKVSRVPTQDRCRVEECILLAAVCTSISHVYMGRWRLDAFRNKVILRSLPEMDVQCAPTIISYPSNPLYDESSWCMLKTEWWNAYACKWEWLRVKTAGRWDMGALGAEGIRLWIFFFSLSVFSSFFKYSQHIFQEAAQLLAVGNVSSKVRLASTVTDGRKTLKKARARY